ncbi:terpenoid synthase [Pholiota conissans]|uniref:Terpene synthase n=1 Tax=Pholiota conissans TaxID=109636 RepID=A0A9P6CZ39_9AGAR|nr:terpenoid synthase [Pholiota conissans]
MSSSSSSSSSQYIIPDLLQSWPWPRVTNDMLDEVRGEALEWVRSLDLFEPRQFQKFEACDFNLLASFIGPLESKAHLRVACDLMNFYFAFDEYTDVASREEAKKIANDVMDAFRRRPLEPSSSKITEMARQFFIRTVEAVGEDSPAIAQFIADFDAYTTAVIQEADDRSEGRVRTVQDYFELRRDTCGAKPSFSFFALGLNMPTEVFEHPVILSLVESATDLISITNDMHSYGLEHSRGLDGHNVITSIMYEHQLDLQGALYWLASYSEKTIAKFLSDKNSLPSWGAEVDASVKEYVDRLGRCVRGYDAWSYETNRYYGNNGLNIRQTRKITLQPRSTGYISRNQMTASIA